MLNNIWDPQHECMPREELEQLQLERLQATLNRVYKNVTCYRSKFNGLGIVPEDVTSLSTSPNCRLPPRKICA